MIPVERPCLPPELEERAEEAQRRRDEALERLLRKLHDVVPPEDDDTHRALVALIDADERKDR